MDKKTMIKVLNRDNGAVVYSLPELNGLVRVYQSGETKEVSFEELQQLSYIPGGKELLEDSLVILNNEKAIQELVGNVEQEYSYTKEDIIKLLTESSLDAFLDCLDFAPQGVLDLIKTLSVELPLNDVSKREAILKKLNFSVDNAIRLKSEENTEERAKSEPKRRVQSSAPTRRVVKTVKE